MKEKTKLQILNLKTIIQKLKIKLNHLVKVNRNLTNNLSSTTKSLKSF